LRFFEIFFSKKVLAYSNLALFLAGFVFGLFVEFLNSSSSIFISAIVFGAAFLIYGSLTEIFFWLIYRLNRFLKLTESPAFKFNSLLLASYNDEENNARPAIKGIGVEVKKESSFLKIALHFFYIIFAGVFVGNVVYIPLFSLQKHYSAEFGILLFIMIILLSVFYVRNYYKIGREDEFIHDE
jgi:hypothetical protein